MGKSYDNVIVAEETSLSIETLLIAPTSPGNINIYDPTTGRVNISSPPAGFTLIGAVKEDTPNLMIKREKYQLKLGLPKSLQYEAIIGLDGEFKVEVYCKTNDSMKLAMGVDITSISTLGTRLPFGRTTIKHYALIGVADFVDGSQVVHYFPHASVKPEVTEAIKSNDAHMINFGYDMYSYISTIHGSERIVGERFYFKPLP